MVATVSQAPKVGNRESVLASLRGRRIGVDVRALTPPITGVGVYLRSLLRELSGVLPETEWFCYSTKPVKDLPSSDRFHFRQGRGLSSMWGSLWLQSGAKSLVAEDGIDLFWGPLQVLPLQVARRLPTVLTLHDLVFERYPETLSWRNRVLLRRLARPSLEAASRVVAVSQTTANAAMNDLGVAPERIKVVANAVDQTPLPALEESRAVVRDRCGVSGDYLLFVGTFEPRKNLSGLLDAIEALIEQGRFDGRVVLAGGRGWRQAGLEAQLNRPNIATRLHRPGYLEGDDLRHLYRAAKMFVMPSLYEGFGIPVLEAMVMGTPVVCSDREPFHEVAGAAAVFASLEQTSGLADAIARVWQDDELRSQLSAKGLERAKQFSWRRSAEQLAETFAELLG